jgi:uncharacterized membrane protein
MKYIVTGLFKDSVAAGKVISHLKEKGYVEDLSVISKDYSKDVAVSASTVKQDISDGTTAGAVVGAAFGTLAAVLAGVTAFAIPPLGLVIAGPLAVALTAAGTGAAIGSIVGALTDAGIPEVTAKLYEERIKNGDTMVAVRVEGDKVNDAKSILSLYQVDQMYAQKDSV